MYYPVKLPSGDALARIINRHADIEESHLRIPFWARWDIFAAYLQGYRRFDGFDHQGNRVFSHWLDKEGKWQAQVHEVLYRLNGVIGALRSLNVAPFVRRTGNSLPMIRDAAGATIIAESTVSADHLNAVHEDICFMAAAYGCCFLNTAVHDDPSAGLCTYHEAIHPSQCLPFPSLNADRSGLQGLIRQRILPLDTLVEIYGNSVKGKARQMQLSMRRFGENLDRPASWGFYGSGHIPPVTVASRPPESSDSFPVVKFREMWCHDSEGRLYNYGAISGHHVFEEIDYRDVPGVHFCPVQRIGFFDNGHFYYTGYVDLLFSLVREFDRTFKQMLSNARDASRYPVTLIPAGLVNDKRIMKDDGTDLRFVTYTPEQTWMAQNRVPIRPITIAPHQSGPELPGRTSTFLLDMLDRYDVKRDIIRDKGRVDSWQGLNFLEEKSKEPLSNPVKSIAAGWGRAHRYGTQQAAAKLVASPKAIPVKNIDLSLLGATIDWTNYTVDFSNNPLPDVRRLDFTIKEASPASHSVLKQEAYGYVTQGHVSIDDYKLYLAKKGVEGALFMDDVEAAHRTIMLDILTMYNDGVTPGRALPSPHVSRPAQQLRELDAFMASPEFKAAGVKVRRTFVQYRTLLFHFQRRVLPQDVPDPIDSILSQEAPGGTLPSDQPALVGAPRQ